MSENQKILVLEVVGNSEKIQAQIQDAIDALSPAPDRTTMSIAVSGLPPRFMVIITYVPEAVTP